MTKTSNEISLVSHLFLRFILSHLLHFCHLFYPIYSFDFLHWILTKTSNEFSLVSHETISNGGNRRNKWDRTKQKFHWNFVHYLLLFHWISHDLVIEEFHDSLFALDLLVLFPRVLWKLNPELFLTFIPIGEVDGVETETI